MKKLSFLSLVFAVTTVIFIGCQNPASSSDDGNKLPGTWLSTTNFKSFNNQPFSGISSFFNGGTSVFEYKLTGAGACATEDIPGNNNFRSVTYPVSKDADFTGFKATVKSSASEYYGFAFNINIAGGVWSYYSIILSDNAYMIKYYHDTSSTTIKSWESHNAIKESTSENKITIYTDKDSTIHVLINETDVYQIKEPVLKQGQFGPIVCLRDPDVTNNVSLTVNYTFKDVQKK